MTVHLSLLEGHEDLFDGRKDHSVPWAIGFLYRLIVTAHHDILGRR
ncbi:MAG UNVERIFIED_CONTAM: hypothetical protein LVR18_31550 [Planctomycetaceae bacterium]